MKIQIERFLATTALIAATTAVGCGKGCNKDEAKTDEAKVEAVKAPEAAPAEAPKPAEVAPPEPAIPEPLPPGAGGDDADAKEPPPHVETPSW
jgi:hypothetical protein